MSEQWFNLLAFIKPILLPPVLKWGGGGWSNFFHGIGEGKSTFLSFQMVLKCAGVIF